MNVEVPATEKKKKDPISEEDKHYYDNDLSLVDRNFLKKLHRMSKTVYKRLQLLACLGDIVRSNFVGFCDENCGPWPVPLASLTAENFDWWLPKHDQDLLAGIYKHGFGRYDQTRLDKQLCFFWECLV